MYLKTTLYSHSLAHNNFRIPFYSTIKIILMIQQLKFENVLFPNFKLTLTENASIKNVEIGCAQKYYFNFVQLTTRPLFEFVHLLRASCKLTLQTNIFSFLYAHFPNNTMMQKKLMITLLSLLVLHVVTSQECIDNPDRFSFTNKKGVVKRKKCVWAANKSTFKRCKKDAIAENCPNTCSPDCLRPPNSATGCRDFPFIFQFLSSKKFKDCAWVAKNAGARCPKYPAKVYCPLVCSTCGAEPSASPTLSLQPTKSPTRAPSSTPSLSNNPSKDPSKKPSLTPTFICEADSAAQFYVQAPVGSYKPCDPWVKNNVAERCVLATGLGGVSTGVVSDYCPETCGGCPNSPSANPTLSMKPSRVPTDEPSQSPSMTSESPSDSPSLLPSDEPSRTPTGMPSDQVRSRECHDVTVIFCMYFSN